MSGNARPPVKIDQAVLLGQLHVVEDRKAHRPHLDGTSRLKVYVRDAADADAVAAQLEARLGTRVPWLMLHADVCRRELLDEIEGMHGVGA